MKWIKSVVIYPKELIPNFNFKLTLSFIETYRKQKTILIN